MPKAKRDQNSIPVVDIFAGPGGLNEGFSSFTAPDRERPFSARLSIERDPTAHLTLTLRAFFRQFPPGRVHADYYDFLRNIDTPLGDRLDWLFGRHPAEAVRASQEARRAELGEDDPEMIRGWIDEKLSGAENWVLLGGPPCQAYSLAGRSRNKGIEDYDPLKDKKQFLYKEYLQILADHLPAVFIMENVKGLLSATIEEEFIFKRICEDLHDPVRAVRREGRGVRHGRGANNRYRLFSLVDYKGKGQSYSLFETADDDAGLSLDGFVVRMERHGVPQARHRLIILGVREDLGRVLPKTLGTRAPVEAERVLSDLPRLRSGLSREADGARAWAARLREMSESCLFEAARKKGGEEVFARLTAALGQIAREELGRGGEFIPGASDVNYQSEWLSDRRLGGVCNHSTRSHIVADLYRYFYAACFAQAHSRSPNLRDFPEQLLPAHRNASAALKGNNFSDRFRAH